VQVSAQPQQPAAAPAEPAAQPAARLTARGKLALVGLGVLALFLVNATAPQPIPQHFTVLVLSVVIGFYVIGQVHHALHTPLMSVTNAISGIIVVGAMGQVVTSDNLVKVLAFVAILLASINVFGGFAVTRRMLGMFQKG
jgi:NAD(P) transhydrogenase subunit alpha